MKKHIAISCLLLASACSSRLFLIHPTRGLGPAGIPKMAWQMCYDEINNVLNQGKKDTLNNRFVHAREWECAETYLIEACGRWLDQQGHFTTMWGPNERQLPYFVFSDYMKHFADQCEDEGYDTPFVRSLVEGFERQAREGNLSCVPSSAAR